MSETKSNTRPKSAAERKQIERNQMAAVVRELKKALEPGENLLAFARGRIAGGIRGKINVGLEALIAPDVNVGLTEGRLLLQHVQPVSGRASEMAPHAFTLAELQSIDFADIETFGGSPASRLLLRLPNDQQFRVRLEGSLNLMNAKALAAVFQAIAKSARPAQSPTMRECVECGGTQDQPFRFCPFCGAAQPDQPSSAAETTMTEAGAPEAPVAEPAHVTLDAQTAEPEGLAENLADPPGETDALAAAAHEPAGDDREVAGQWTDADAPTALAPSMMPEAWETNGSAPSASEPSNSSPPFSEFDSDAESGELAAPEPAASAPADFNVITSVSGSDLSLPGGQDESEPAPASSEIFVAPVVDLPGDPASAEPAAEHAPAAPDPAVIAAEQQEAGPDLGFTSPDSQEETASEAPSSFEALPAAAAPPAPSGISESLPGHSASDIASDVPPQSPFAHDGAGFVVEETPEAPGGVPPVTPSLLGGLADSRPSEAVASIVDPPAAPEFAPEPAASDMAPPRAGPSQSEADRIQEMLAQLRAISHPGSPALENPIESAVQPAPPPYPRAELGQPWQAPPPEPSSWASPGATADAPAWGAPVAPAVPMAAPPAEPEPPFTPEPQPVRGPGPLRAHIHIHRPPVHIDEIIQGADAEEIVARFKARMMPELSFAMRLAVGGMANLRFAQEVVKQYNVQDQGHLPMPSSCEEFLEAAVKIGFVTIER